MEILRRYWKQFAGWVIGSKHKLLHDPFVESKVVVIILQLFFALILFINAAVFFNYIYQDVFRTVVSGISKSVILGNTNGDEIINSLELIKSERFILFFAVGLIIALLFTYAVSKVTLRPVRNALDSQKRFVSDIAHELRTPLAIIKANSEVLLMDEHLNPKVKALIESNVEELDRTSGIINNLLSLKNLIQPEHIKFENVDVGPIIDSVVNKLKNLTEEKNLKITIKKVAPHVVWGNAAALEQIITNLAKNAINYTPKNGHVTIRTGPDYAGNILLHIEDTGIGIVKKDLLHIFEPFYRADRSRSRSQGSSGLGLTIVSELVKMHSGRITIKSAENKGTVAIVALPHGKTDESDTEQGVDLSELNEISENFLQKK